MENLNRRKRSHATQVAASVAVAAVVAGAAGIAAGQGNAAPALKAHEAHPASYRPGSPSQAPRSSGTAF